jgi:hypothetical protein
VCERRALGDVRLGTVGESETGLVPRSHTWLRASRSYLPLSLINAARHTERNGVCGQRARTGHGRQEACRARGVALGAATWSADCSLSTRVSMAEILTVL